MTILYLCEKPSQARDIARALNVTKKQEGYIEGKNIVVTWCIGHLLEMAPPDYYCDDLKPWRIEKLPIIPNHWQMQIVDKTKKQFATIKKLLKTVNQVVIATDCDREGEVIAREILDFCQYRGKIQRLWLSALDDVSIQKALANLKEGAETEKLYFAGLARQRADWLVGMNLTMATSCLFGKYGEGALSVGRVQTPTLKLVVDRDQEIENFKPKDYFVVFAEFKTTKHKSFFATWQVPLELTDAEGRCINRQIADQVLNKINGQTARINVFEENQKQQTPPLCLSLSALQKLASSRFGFSVKQTLDIAQSLYETHKATTYPRTDCGYLPESQRQEVPQILKALQHINLDLTELIVKCDTKLKSSVWNDKKITAHHGIIPTINSKVDITKMSEAEYKIYDVICRHYLAQFLGDYVYSTRTATVNCQNELFKASDHTPLTLGWRNALQTTGNEAEEAHIPQSSIPLLKIDESVTCNNQNLETKQTKPPARFTEGNLIDAMKNVGKYINDSELKKVLKDTAGIGTEATRASILETFFKREHLSRQGKQIISTAKGRALIHLLPKVTADPATTARWEQELEAIAEGKATLESFLLKQANNIHVLLDSLAEKKAQHPDLKMPQETSKSTTRKSQFQKNQSPRRTNWDNKQKPASAGNRQDIG